MSVVQQNGAAKRLETSSPEARSNAPGKGPGLERQLREGAAGFDFAVLLGGVPPAPQAAPTEPEKSAAEKHAPSFLPKPSAANLSAAPNRKLFYLTSALVSAVTALVVCAGFNLAVNRSGPLPAVLPERAANARPLYPASCLRMGMPDPVLTPGEGGPYLLSREAIPIAAKREVFARYGLEFGDPKYVTAYLVPGSLGGTNHPKNLFPVKPWFLTLKKRLDKALTNEVLEGHLTVGEARREIAADWLAAMRKRGLRNHGQPAGAGAEPAKLTEKLGTSDRSYLTYRSDRTSSAGGIDGASDTFSPPSTPGSASH